MSEENDLHWQSNRPYTLFYYPSSQLTQCAMSENEICRFWCLLDGEKKPFSVAVGLRWDVDQLTKAIRQEKCVLRDLDNSDIVLWKVTDAIQIEPAKTLIERCPSSITDFSVKLDRWTQKVSDVFTVDLAENNLQIIVKLELTDQRPSKKPRLGSPDLPEISDHELARCNLLWHTFWGKPASECCVKASVCIPDLRTLEINDETKYEYLKLPNDDFFPCGSHRILITQTYKSLYAKLCQQDAKYAKIAWSARLLSLAHSTIITGQPGTGKSVGLSCILVWRLQEKKPTVYCSSKIDAYVFTSTGVRRVSLKDGKRIKALDSSIYCCGLVDIHPGLTKLPSQFHPTARRQGRVVVATSDHIIAFKQNPAKTYYVPTWKWPDLYCARLLRASPLTVETLRDVYTKLGGIPRRCFRALFRDGEEHEMNIIKDAINRVDNIKNFAGSATLPFKDDVSCALFRVEPTDDTWERQSTHLLSNYVADLLYDRISAMNMRDSNKAFTFRNHTLSV